MGLSDPFKRVVKDLKTSVEKREQEREDLGQFQRFFAGSSDMMSLLDESLTYLAVNEAYAAAFGLKCEEFVGKTPRCMFGEEFFEGRIKPSAQRCLRGESVRYHAWMEFPVAGRRYMEVSYSPCRDSANRFFGLAVTVRDITDRERIEEVLLRSEERYRLLVHHAPVSIHEIDREGRVISMNRAGLKMLEAEDASSICGLAYLDFVSSGDRERIRELLDRAFEGVSSQFEFSGNDVGERSFFSSNFIPIKGPDNQVVCVMGVSQDITARRSTDEALEQFHSVTSNQTGMEFLVALTRGLVEQFGVCHAFVSELVNHETLRTMVFCRDGVISDNFEYSRRGTPCEEVLRDGVGFFTSGVQQRFPSDEWLKKEGVEGYMAISFQDPQGRSMGHLGIMDSKPLRRVGLIERLLSVFAPRVGAELSRLKAESSAVESRQRLALALESVRGGVWDWNLDSGKLVPSALWWRDSGSNVPELGPQAQSWEMLVHPEDLPKFREEMDSHLEGRKAVFEVQNRFRRENGAYGWNLVRGRVVDRDPAGRAVRMVGIDIDITERKQMEDQISRVHSLESIGVLAGGIAHDFNNLLTGVIGALSLLRMCVDEKTREHRLACDAEKSAMRAADLTAQLMTFAKGGAPIKRSVAIDQLMRETAGLNLRGSSCLAEYDFGSDLHSVDVDSTQIGQVLQNLVLNASQSMPEGGVISLSARNLELSGSESPPLKPGKYVEVTVADHGTGMSADVVSHVFDPYFSTKSSGRGLGLSITYRIIQRHAGNISVHSEVGQGSRFVVLLPASQKPILPDSDDSSVVLRGTGKILLMDDEELIHSAVGGMLNELGYEVVAVLDGSRAVETYQAATEGGSGFDVVIMDLTIPGGMGGKEAVQRLLEFDSKARVIVSSGYADDPVMANYRDYGFCGRLQKPMDLAKLSKAVNEALANR